MLCEQRLIKLCSPNSFVYIDHVADLYNANRLKEFCHWYQRINPQVSEMLERAAEVEAAGVDHSNVSRLILLSKISVKQADFAVSMGLCRANSPFRRVRFGKASSLRRSRAPKVTAR